MKHNVFEQNAFDNNADVVEEEQEIYRKNVFADYLLNAGLYKPFEITRANYCQLIELMNGNVKISAYCNICKEYRVFSMQSITVPFFADGKVYPTKLGDIVRSEHSTDGMPFEAGLSHKSGEKTLEWSFSKNQSRESTRVMVFPFKCSLVSSHRLDFIVRIDGNTLKKIGQCPSIADLSFPELDEFKKVIDEQSRKELRRAIGLHAQGIGVGSYVYLRRIFERILDEAKTESELAGTVDFSGYPGMRVAERIRLLKDYLPALINDNTMFYSIVSKGIHELSEDECISYFPVLKEAIFMILRQWAQKKQEQEDAKRLSASLSKIASQVNS